MVLSVARKKNQEAKKQEERKKQAASSQAEEAVAISFRAAWLLGRHPQPTVSRAPNDCLPNSTTTKRQ